MSMRYRAVTVRERFLPRAVRVVGMRLGKCSIWAFSACFLFWGAHVAAQDDAKQRAKAVRDYAKGAGSEVIPKLEPYLADTDVDVRLEAVKAIVDIGTQRSLDPLIKAA